MRMILVAVLVAAMPLAPAAAQTSSTTQPAESAQPAQQTQATESYSDVMARMHRDMMATKPTGDMTQDFARMMIPHHQGAIDMARIVLQHTQDDEIRDMAEDLIEEQEEEIKDLQEWLSKHPSTASQTQTQQ